MIDTIVVLLQRNSRIRNKERSDNAIIGKLQSPICRYDSENIRIRLAEIFQVSQICRL